MDVIGGRRLAIDETRALLRADRQQLLSLMTGADQARIARSWRAVWFYRWSQYHYGRGRRNIGRLFWHANLFLTGADVSPVSDFGPGLVIVSPQGVTLFVVAGTNLTVHAQTAVGGGRSNADIGAGPGRPLLGDHVVLEHGAVVLGPVKIGDRARIGAGCVVMTDVAPDTTLEVAPPEFAQRKSRHA